MNNAATTTLTNMTNRQIRALQSEAASHGDPATVALCDIAIGSPATGRPAVELARLWGVDLDLGSNEVDGAAGPIHPDDDRIEEILETDPALLTLDAEDDEDRIMRRIDVFGIIAEAEAI